MARTAFGTAFRSSLARFAFLIVLSVPLSAKPRLPAGVPDGYVITPFGYFHPSCVRRLLKGESFVSDGHFIRHADGSFEQVPECGYPRFDPRGGRLAAVSGPPPEISHAYVEYASVFAASGSSFGELKATWQVPPSPADDDGQVLYFFPGLEDRIRDKSILQPVLGYDSGSWSIASWNCCPSGITVESPVKVVSPGDTIQGDIKSTCAPGVLSCATWNVTTQDVTDGQTTTLGDTTNNGQTFDWAFAGALEVYNVAQCGDYPADDSLTFSGLQLYDYKFNLISNPAWTTDVSSTAQPECNYGVPLGTGQITLDYAGFTLTDSPDSLVLDAGGAPGGTTVTVDDVDTFSSPISLVTQNLPAGVTAVFESNPTASGSLLQFTADSGALPGTYVVTVRGTDSSGEMSAATVVVLTIANPSPTPSVTPSVTSTYTDSPTATISPTFTISPTVTASPTITPTWTVSQVIPGRTGGVVVYPNPSSGNVRFAFPPKGQSVRLEIYNLAGQRVADLGASFQEAQDGFVPWDGGGGSLATGIYLVVLDEDGRLYRGKFAILGPGSGTGSGGVLFWLKH
jgi:hypothetical protein